MADQVIGDEALVARGLVDAGAAILIPERLLNAESLTAQIKSLLENPAASLQMANAALSVGAPDATERLVALVDSLAKER